MDFTENTDFYFKEHESLESNECGLNFTLFVVLKEHESLESNECGLNLKARISSCRAQRAHSCDLDYSCS